LLQVRTARLYHDDASFGYRVPSKYTLPDCECYVELWDDELAIVAVRYLQSTIPAAVAGSDRSELTPDTEKELNNRNDNAQLLRYVEMVRRHGHRAAQVDPLDLMERE
jgi:probable 2-oxoglutarate dehydrogenase E1 component DHKTD1